MTKLAKSKEMIMNYAINNQNKITKREAVEYIGYRYDSDTKNHVGRVLSKLVKEFKLTRIRNGNFEVVPDRETVLTNALKDCLELLYECNPPDHLFETYSNIIMNYSNLVRNWIIKLK